MDEAYIRELCEIGVDVQDNMVRFMNNEALFEKVLKMFLDDSSYSEMKQGFEQGDCEMAFKGAHSLKGVAANLGLNKILEKLVPAVEVLRKGSMDVSEADLKIIDDRYNEICSLIRKYNNIV